MKRYSLGLLACIWLSGSLSYTQTPFDGLDVSFSNLEIGNQNFVIPGQVQQAAQVTGSKSLDVLKLLLEGKTLEAVQVTIEHLTSLVPSYLAPDPTKQTPYLQEVTFLQFIQAYQFGETLLSHMPATTDLLHHAAITEMIGQEEQAMSLYQKASNDIRIRKRYAFLLAKYNRIEEAKAVLSGIEPSDFAGVIQSLQSLISSQNTYAKRLDYFDLLITALEHVDPSAYLKAEWLPEFINNYFAEGNQIGVRLADLYRKGDQRAGYDTPEQEERSEKAAARRLTMHETLCKAMMRLPQFADEGFRRYSGMAARHGVEDTMPYLAMTIIKMPAAPNLPDGYQEPVMSKNFRSNWVPFHSPVEFLLRQAIQKGSVGSLVTTLSPILGETDKHGQVTFLREFNTLLESSPDTFPQQAAALMRQEKLAMSPNDLLRMLLEIMKTRKIADNGPLIEALIERNADSPYTQLNEIQAYAQQQRKLGLEHYQTFLNSIAKIMLGPKDQQADFIATHYQPNTYSVGTPSMRTYNYMAFLSHMGQKLDLLAPVLAEVYGRSFVHPNDYQMRNVIRNSLQSWSYNNQFKGLTTFLKDSPFLSDLEEFRPYPMQNVERNSVFGHFLESLRQVGSSDRSRILQTVRSHKKDTFGKQAILAFSESISNSSARSLALARVMEAQIEAIGILPRERQWELYEWFRQMHSSRSSLNSSIRTACPKTDTWYNAMKATTGKRHSQQSGRNMQRRTSDGLPSIEKFLAAETRHEIEPSPLLYTATQLAQSVFSSDLPQAEAIVAKFLDLAAQDSGTNTKKTSNENSKTNIDSLLASLLMGSPGTENLGFTIKMIHLAKDPNQGVYPQLQGPMMQALANESFEPVSALQNDMAKTFLEASGGQVHDLLLPLLLNRFKGLKAETLESICEWAKQHASNPLASLLFDSANLSLATVEGGKPLAPPELVTRLTTTERPLALRAQACPTIFHMALQAKAWHTAEACLTVLQQALEDQDLTMPAMITEQIMVAPAKGVASVEEKHLLKRLLILWSAHGQRLPMSMAALKRATALATRAAFPTSILLEKLPESLQRQPGFVLSLLRMDASDAALKAVPWSLTAMPPLTKMSSSRSRRSNSRSMRTPVMATQTGQYDADLHAKSAAFLPKIADSGQRFFVELNLATLSDAVDLPDTVPNREIRLQSLANRYDRKDFTSPYLAEHTVSWLCGSIGKAPKAVREDLTQFGIAMAYQPLSRWSDSSLHASRMNIWNHFLKDASTQAPDVFATVINEMIETMSGDRHQLQTLLETYVGDFPKSALKDISSMTPEKAAAYLPLLKNLSQRSRRVYWSGRDECINGNIVMHVLANQGQAYNQWRNELDYSTRYHVEGNVNLDEIVFMMRHTLSADKVSKERRSQILNGLFATTAPSPKSNMNRSQDTSVFERMIDLDVLTADDILENGPQWADQNPRGGTAFGELAKYQEEAGQVDEAIVNYTQAVVHSPSSNQWQYTQYHLANAKLLLKQDRVEAAMTWFDFVNSGRIHSNYQSEHAMLKRQAQLRYLTTPDRMTSTFAHAKQRLAADPQDTTAWIDLAKTLSAYGVDRMAQSDYIRGLSVLKLAYYLLHQVKQLDPSMVDELMTTVADDLSKGMIALGMGGRKKELVTRQRHWAYHYQEGGLEDKEWRYDVMSSADWARSRAPIGYGNGNETTVIDFGDDEDNKPITAYFNKQVTIDDLHQGDQLTLSVLHDDGVIVYIDGKEVARNNMPTGHVGPQTRATNSRGGSDEKEYWSVTLPSTVFDTERSSHIIAAEVHQNDNESSDLSFDLELYTEAFNAVAIIEDVETGNPLKQLVQWKDQLPEKLIDLAKDLSKR